MKDRLRIAVVNKHPSDVLGGSEIQTDMIANGLHDRGHEVTYGAVDGRRSAYDAPYRVLPLGPDFGHDFRRFLAEANPEVIYWRHNKRRLLIAVLLAKQARVPFVFGVSHVRDVTPWAASSKPPVQGRGLRSRTLGRARWFLKTLDGRLNHLALGMVDAATTLNRDYLDRLPVKNRVHLPNAVPENAVPFSWPRPFVLWVANVKASKHPEAYIEVAARCADLPIDFLMVGRMAQSYYQDVLASSGLPPNLRYLGARTPQEVNGMLREALFLVHTCHPEGFGNIFIQAWQAGRPTLSLHFDPEGLIEGWRVGNHCKDIDTLVRRARDLATADGIREEMGNRALELGAQYSVEQTVTRIEEFLVATVCRSRGAPSPPEVGGERR